MSVDYPEAVAAYIREQNTKLQDEKSYEDLELLRKGLREKVQIQDEYLIEDLLSLGFTPNTVAALPIVPLIQIAWADGEIQREEAKLQQKLAHERGIELGVGDAWKHIEKLLTTRPEDAYMQGCSYVLRAIYDKLPNNEAAAAAKQNMFSFAHAVAKAAGGFLGLFGDKVSIDERKALEELREMFGMG